MVKHGFSLFKWLLNLFDPPPLASMTLTQKIGRIALLTGTIMIGSILVAMFGAVGLFVMEKGREMGNAPEFLDGICIIFIGVVVNAVCMAVLVQIKHADHKLIPPPEAGKAMAESQMKGK